MSIQLNGRDFQRLPIQDGAMVWTMSLGALGDALQGLDLVMNSLVAQVDKFCAKSQSHLATASSPCFGVARPAATI